MAIVQSGGLLTDQTYRDWYPATLRSVRLYDQYTYDYATLYRSQPNVRTCVDFLARNIAQLGLHVFRRVNETDRERLRDHPLAQVISRPLPAEFKVTRYRLIESLMADLGVYFNGYWLKIRVDNAQLGLLRIPPPYMDITGGLVPTAYTMTIPGRQPETFRPDQVVHFRGYNAESSITGLSPLETLRRILAEEHEAGDYREHFWANAARMYGIIERPKEAADWSETARDRFRADFETLYTGGANSGRTAVLEEGMSWKAMQFNAQESEYLAGRKLTREECARAYHIPLPMVGILDNATFSNITEQHKNLYQDCLGPWLAMIEEDIQLQLLYEFGDTSCVYVEFNIAEKLQGSFTEQVESLQAAVGRPWMTPDEARSRLNLPSMGGDAEQLATPLNVLIGGQASPRDSAPPPKAKAKGEGELDPINEDIQARHIEQWSRLLVRTFNRQRAAVLGKIDGKDRKELPDIAVLWDAERWNRELAADFFRLSGLTAFEFGQYVAEQLDFELNRDEMLPYLEENSRIAAEYTNASTQGEIEAALLDESPRDALQNVFETAVVSRAGYIALGRVTELSSFGAHDAARQGGLGTKTWITGSNPRPSHAAMNGVTVDIRNTFPNGLRWPGDSRGSAKETAGCNCRVRFGRR